MAKREAMYAYVFEGRRHDVGDKLGFLQATVEFALMRDDLKDDFLSYLEGIVQKEKGNRVIEEVAVTTEKKSS